MNEFKVLAIKKISFKDDRGIPVSGSQVWLYGQTGEPGWVEGYEIVKAWISDTADLADIASDLIPGLLVNVKFSRRGRVIDIGVA